MSRLPQICLCLLLALTGWGSSGAEPKRVLFIHSFGRGFEPYHTVAGLLRTELASQMGEPIDFFEASLESARFTSLDQESPLLGYLQAQFAQRHLDMVVPIGGPAAQFAQRHRQQLFPDTPMLAAADQRLFNRTNLTDKDAAVLMANEPALTVGMLLQLLPETTNVVVVVGNSAIERFWSSEIKSDLETYTNRVSFEWLNGLPFSEMLKHCAALPPHSAIFFPLLFIDAAGVPHLEEHAMLRLHEVANAPIFGIWGNQLGQGILGGRLMDVEGYSRTAASAAARILRGESPGSIDVPPQRAGPPEFDWQELRRWRISEGRLPSGSVVRFREAGVWERYWGWICGGVLFAAVEGALIVGLLVSRKKRHQEEMAATMIAELSSRFVNVPAGMVDREIEEAQRKVCEGMGLDLSALWQWTEEPMRYFKMTHLYRPMGGPPIPERFDAQEVFPWCLKLLLAGKAIPVSSMAELPAEAGRDRASWEHFGIKSNLTFPLLMEGGQLIGGLSFNTVRKARAWPEEVVVRLELVAQIFTNALARKRADQELRESEARLTLAAEAAAAGLWRLDFATNTFWVTNKTRELFAFGADEVVTFDRFMNLVHPGDREFVGEKVQQVLRSQGEIQVEYRILQPDGRVKWMQSQGRVHCDVSGRADYLMGVTVDGTARKQAEEALKESEGRFRRVVQHIQDALMVDDIEGRVVFANERFLELFGVRREELATLTLEDYVAPEFRAELRERHERRVRGEKEPANFEYLGMRRDGRKLWLEVAVVSVTDEQGRIIGTQSAIRDIDDRKRAEEALQISEARLASAVQVAELGFYEMGTDAGQIFIDERLRALLGLTPQDGHRVQEFWIEHIHADDRERVQEVSRRVLSGELEWTTVEYRYQHPERGTLWFSHISRAQDKDTNGKVVRRLGVIRDVTEQRRAELESQRLRGNLAHLTRVNTLGALSGSLAHELNQPLGIILSNAEAAQDLLAQTPPDTVEVQAILADIVKADRRAGEVIKRLRALFKSGQASLQRLSVNEVIEEVLRLTRAELLGRGVTIIRELAAELPPIAGDPVQLQQLVLNLIMNAADAMAANAPGTRRLHLRTMRHLDCVRACVRDEGEGLPSNVEHIFQPLYTTKPQGLGMGLAICRSIVAAHNGRLWAERHPERGAVFYFELPGVTRDEGRGARGEVR